MNFWNINRHTKRFHHSSIPVPRETASKVGERLQCVILVGYRCPIGKAFQGDMLCRRLRGRRLLEAGRYSSSHIGSEKCGGYGYLGGVRGFRDRMEQAGRREGGGSRVGKKPLGRKPTLTPFARSAFCRKGPRTVVLFANGDAASVFGTPSADEIRQLFSIHSEHPAGSLAENLR